MNERSVMTLGMGAGVGAALGLLFGMLLLNDLPLGLLIGVVLVIAGGAVVDRRN